MKNYREIIEWLAINLDQSEVDSALKSGLYVPAIVFAAFIADVDEEEIVKDLRDYMNIEGIT